MLLAVSSGYLVHGDLTKVELVMVAMAATAVACGAVLLCRVIARLCVTVLPQPPICDPLQQNHAPCAA